MKALKDKGFESAFLKEYRSAVFTQKSIERFSAGDPAVMEEITNLYDEWTYFHTDFGDTVILEET